MVTAEKEPEIKPGLAEYQAREAIRQLAAIYGKRHAARLMAEFIREELENGISVSRY